MKTHQVRTQAIGALLAMSVAAPVAAFNSGSTGADGAFNPTVNTELQLPPSGIFNFTSVNIPAGVTVTFKKNVTNTPVVILASGDVTIAGTINLSGSASTNVGAAGDGNLGDDGIPGSGGPGGYDGGVGGAPGIRGGDGRGPGGGGGGGGDGDWYFDGGGGAGFGQGGASTGTGAGGPAYGSNLLLPLVGGSGGGGGRGGSFVGSGGGGGGGAILIAASGTVSITGAIVANGGSSGVSSGYGAGGTGGGGSGGAIRIVATTLSGNGTINALPGAGGQATTTGTTYVRAGGSGGVGRIRLEAENISRTAASNPAHSFGAPGPVFIAGLPTLRITSVAGVLAPMEPTGNADITLPVDTVNPVTVEFATTGVPVGNTVKLTVKPANAAATSVISPALTGTTDSATASVQVNLPGGPSALEATTTYTIVASLGDALGAQYAQGERVERIELAASLNGASTATLITVSGKRYPLLGPIPAMVADQG